MVIHSPLEPFSFRRQQVQYLVSTADRPGTRALS
jgi:hypothetical protein